MIDLKGAISASERIQKGVHHFGDLSDVLNFLKSLPPQEALETEEDPHYGFPAPGEQVVFLGKNGTERDLNKACAEFKVGEVLTIEETSVASFSSDFKFVGHEGIWNTVHFKRYEPLTAPTDQPDEWEECEPSEATHFELNGIKTPCSIEDGQMINRATLVWTAENETGGRVEIALNLCQRWGYKFLKQQRKTLTAQIQEIFPQADSEQVAAIEKLVGWEG